MDTAGSFRWVKLWVIPRHGDAGSPFQAVIRRRLCSLYRTRTECGAAVPARGSTERSPVRLCKPPSAPAWESTRDRLRRLATGLSAPTAGHCRTEGQRPASFVPTPFLLYSIGVSIVEGNSFLPFERLHATLPPSIAWSFSRLQPTPAAWKRKQAAPSMNLRTAFF